MSDPLDPASPETASTDGPRSGDPDADEPSPPALDGPASPADPLEGAIAAALAGGGLNIVRGRER